jgi:predicted dehydrogenase
VSKPRVCIIGCGGIGKHHLRILETFDDVELAGFCDIIPERAEEFAAKTGGRAYTDFRAMYDAEQPDMVFILIPPDCHGAIEFETVERGIPMFVEKPVSLDLAQAQEIARRVKEKGLITAAGFQCRYAGFNPIAKAYANENPIVTASAARVGGMVATPWFREQTKSGGQIVEQAIHQLDILRYILGEPDTVYTMARKGIITRDEWPGLDIDEATCTVVSFRSGAMATITAGVYAQNNEASDYGMVFRSRNTRMEYGLNSHATVYGPGDEQKEVYQSMGKPGADCDRAFIDAVLSGDGSAILSPYEDGVKSLAFALATVESTQTGQPVKV